MEKRSRGAVLLVGLGLASMGLAAWRGLASAGSDGRTVLLRTRLELPADTAKVECLQKPAGAACGWAVSVS